MSNESAASFGVDVLGVFAMGGAITACSSLGPRSRTGPRTGEKKAARRIDADRLDGALADLSGYIAANELYDGPSCILSIVDNRTFERIAYHVLSHDPNQDDHRTRAA
jgi:hypothetical protein